MSKLEIKYLPGATPLDPNELDGLIPDYITTQGELNTLERENIVEAADWLFEKKHEEILNASFVFELHKRMLHRVWKWAGKPRGTNKNIGVPKEQISNQLATLLEDTKYWIKNQTYQWDEIGARFHHRLVAIHIFVNGNGRHARLMTDALLSSRGQEPFFWGMKTAKDSSLDVAGIVRQEYILALKEADAQKFSRLLKFVRS